MMKCQALSNFYLLIITLVAGYAASESNSRENRTARDIYSGQYHNGALASSPPSRDSITTSPYAIRRLSRHRDLRLSDSDPAQHLCTGANMRYPLKDIGGANARTGQSLLEDRQVIEDPEDARILNKALTLAGFPIHRHDPYDPLSYDDRNVEQREPKALLGRTMDRVSQIGDEILDLENQRGTLRLQIFHFRTKIQRLHRDNPTYTLISKHIKTKTTEIFQIDNKLGELYEQRRFFPAEGNHKETSLLRSDSCSDGSLPTTTLDKKREKILVRFGGSQVSQRYHRILDNLIFAAKVPLHAILKDPTYPGTITLTGGALVALYNYFHYNPNTVVAPLCVAAAGLCCNMFASTIKANVEAWMELRKQGKETRDEKKKGTITRTRARRKQKISDQFQVRDLVDNLLHSSL